VAQASQTAEKTPPEFCHSERSEESLFLFMGPNRREIPRFARNDKIKYFFRNLFSLCGFVAEGQLQQAEACATRTRSNDGMRESKARASEIRVILMKNAGEILVPKL
jgi:hypothetical protein